MSIEQVVVVGASLAGSRTAEALRAGGYDGRLTLIGAEEHVPYDRPPLSKQLLAGTKSADDIKLHRDGVLDGLDLDLRLGRQATDLDLSAREVVLHGGDRVPFDALVLATGSTPRLIPGTPDLRGLHVLRTLDDAVALRTEMEAGPRVAVVGGGFIGAEVAATARGRGLEVTVIEALPVPLARGLGPQLGATCGDLHVDHGVDLRLGVGVAGFEGNGRVEAVTLSDGSRVDADLVVVGIGVIPQTAWLESSGLELRDGIVCDATLQAVGAPGVYAAGDVARWPNGAFDEEMRVEHWTNAADQGAAVAANLLAGPGAAVPFEPVPYVWSDQYDTKIQIVGRPSAGDDVQVVHGTLEERRFVALYGKDGRLRGAVGFSRPRLVMQYHRLISQRASWDDALAHAASTDG